ncbi:Clo7bot family Cys-rich peptide [Paenibacillus tianjinensis]|uniref:Clo7bot family Cys-rich peptide n=1 Tax=Paenibacillus tianjinensis TaxID=2810347 RepID=A0ABX7LE44_9BACL|nr:Clo7bot family Cys-rich peptide [Paenibacillus tianjinensis]
MKYIIDPKVGYELTYCFACSKQCNNKCNDQVGCSTLCISK